MTARKTDHAAEPGGTLSVGGRDRACLLRVCVVTVSHNKYVVVVGSAFSRSPFRVFLPRIIIM